MIGRIVLVEPSFQLKHAFGLAAIGALLVLGGAWLAYAQLQAAVSQSGLSDQVAAALHAHGREALTVWLWIALAVIAGLFLLGIWVTHRIAGPVYAMSRYVETLARGRYPITRPLRRADEMQELFALIQDAIEALRKRDQEERFKLEQALTTLGTPGRTAADEQAALEAIRWVVDKKVSASSRPAAAPPTPSPEPAVEAAPEPQKAAGASART